MKRIVFVLALAACGGKSTPPAQPADPNAGEGNGIGQKEAAEGACYEQCLDQGPKDVSGWDTKADTEKQSVCEGECKDAGAGLPSDVHE